MVGPSAEPNASAGPSVIAAVEKTTATGAALAGLATAFLPQHAGIAKSVGYGIAMLLAVATAVAELRRRRLLPKAPVGTRVPESMAGAIIRGLDPFEEGEGDQLVARADDMKNVCRRVMNRDFHYTVLSGESGTGKTSLLRALVMPWLRQKGIRVIYLDKPTADPTAVVAMRLLVEGSAGPESARDGASTGQPRTVIVIDQFEEFFFANASEAARESFKRWLATDLHASSTSGIALLLAIRDDCFGRLRQLAPTDVDLTSSRTSVGLEHFTTQQAKEVLEASNAQTLSPFDGALVAALLGDLNASGRVRATELQLVSSQLKRRQVTTVRDYENLGSAVGILERYIGDEIGRSPHKDLMPIILRTLCSTERAGKAPEDADVATFKRAAEKHGYKAVDDLDKEIADVIRETLIARFVVRSGAATYALVHDFFAHLILRATASLETPSERSDRMLARYLSDFREDARTRIPLRRIFSIWRRASSAATTSAEARRLLRKSALQPLVDVATLLCVVLAPLYVVQICSYSLGTVRASFPNGPAFVVVRSGIPALRFLPLTDLVATDTPFSLLDVPNDKGADAIVHETLVGFRFENVGGYRKWGHDLVEQLAPVARVGAYRLLGDPLGARDTAVAAMASYADLDLVQSIGSGLDPVDDDFLQPLWQMTEERGPDAPTKRAVAALGLLQLTRDRPVKRRPPWTVGEWIATMHVMATLASSGSDASEWPMFPFELVLASVLQSSPNGATPGDLDLLQAILVDPKVPSVAKLSVVRIMQTFAEANPKLAETVVGYLAMLSLKGVLDDVDLQGYALDYIENVVTEMPSSATTSSLGPLVDLVSAVPKTKNAAAPWAAITLSVAILVNPEVLTPPILEGMRSALGSVDAKGDDHLAYTAALTRIASMDRAEADDRAVVKAAQDLLQIVTTNSTDLPFYVLRAITDLCVASPDRCPNPEEVMLRIVGAEDRRDRQSGMRLTLERTTTKASLLAKFARARPEGVTPTLINSIMNQVWPVGPHPDAIFALSTIATINPEALATLLAGTPPEMFVADPRYLVDGQEWLLGAYGRAKYDRSRVADPGRTLDDLLDMLSTDGSRDARTTAVYGFFWLALTDPVLAVTARKDVNDLRSSVRPELRIDASKALEVMNVAAIFHRARQVASESPLCRSRLRYMTQLPDRHVRYAAQVSLDELSMLDGR